MKKVKTSARIEELILQRNVQFLYEEHLARIELAALGCTNLQRDDQDWRILRAEVNGTATAIVNRSAYIGEVGGKKTVYSQLTLPNYQGGRFNRTRSVNQYLTHWIYPYRGKFHPQMVRGLMNILDVRPGMHGFEPFLGSGTTAVECSLAGVNLTGIDLSPLCALLARVKTESWRHVEDIRGRVAALLRDGELSPARAVKREKKGAVKDFLTIAHAVTSSDVARRYRQEDAAFRKNLTAMLESVEAYAAAVAEFKIVPGTVCALVGDARDVRAAGVKDQSLDFVITSPPYSIALDYVKNDKHALEVLGVDAKRLSQTMTGVRGRSAHEKMSHYNEDMRIVFREVARALKPGAGAAFVVGNATVDGREVTTTDTLAVWAEEAGLRRERNIPKIVFGLYNVMNDERILIFRK